MVETYIQALDDLSSNLFDLYALDGGIYWKIIPKQHGTLTLLNCTKTFDVLNHLFDDMVIPGQNIMINYDTSIRLDLITIKFNENEFYVNGFMIHSKHNVNKLPGFIMCGCFDGMTQRHQKLLKIGASIIEANGYGCVFIDKGEAGEKKHHSEWGFMNNFDVRKNAVIHVLSSLFRKRLKMYKKTFKNYNNVIIKKRTCKWIDSIKYGINELKKKGVNKIYYVCGVDQMENFKNKMDDDIRQQLSILAIERVSPEENNTKSSYIVADYINISNKMALESCIDFNSLTRTCEMSTSSTNIRQIFKIKKHMNHINIMRDIDMNYILQHITRVTFGNELDCYIKTHQCKPSSKFDMSTLTERSKIILYLQGRTVSQKDMDSVSSDSSSLLFMRFKQINQSYNPVFLIINYKDRKTESKNILDQIYDSNFEYISKDAYSIATEIFGPFIFTRHFYFDGTKFHGERYSNDIIINNFKKFKIITRSMGSIIGHMVGYCLKLMVEDYDILKYIDEFDFGPVIGLENRFTFFNHIILINTKDTHALDRINYRHIPDEFKDTKSVLYVYEPINEPFIVFPDGRKYYLKNKVGKDAAYIYHSCLSYFGYSESDKSNKIIDDIFKLILARMSD